MSIIISMCVAAKYSCGQLGVALITHQAHNNIPGAAGQETCVLERPENLRYEGPHAAAGLPWA